MITKQHLLDELTNHTYVILKPSAVAGIGVFAVKDIAAGCRAMFNKPDPADAWIAITKNEVDALPAHAKYLIENYCLFDEEKYFVPDYGFKKIDLSLFLNHSDTPNIISIEEGNYFEAIRNIGAGEELFIDYGQIVEGEE